MKNKLIIIQFSDPLPCKIVTSVADHLHSRFAQRSFAHSRKNTVAIFLHRGAGLSVQSALYS